MLLKKTKASRILGIPNNVKLHFPESNIILSFSGFFTVGNFFHPFSAGRFVRLSFFAW